MSVETYISLVVAVVALFVSIIALIYTVKTYFLKAGAKVRGSYSMCSNIACEDRYISSLTLENLKDRAVIIFKVYLQLGHNYFIEIENFEEEPLILKPFEVFRKEYEPLDFYSINTNRILINDLLDNKSVQKRIVLSTSNGKYKINSTIDHWDPIGDFFRNHMTAVIRPMRSTYKGKSYGINAKYIVDLKMDNGIEETVAIYPRDYEIKKFKNFNLIQESLVSKDALEEFLYDQVEKGKLNCVDLSVHEMESWRNEVYEFEQKKIFTASYYSWFKYHIVGSIYTKISNYQLRKKNKKAQKKALI